MLVRRTFLLAALAAMLCAVIMSPLQAAEPSDSAGDITSDDTSAEQGVGETLSAAEDVAVDALDNVRGLLTGEASEVSELSQPELGSGVPQADATLALRDLALHQDELSGSERTEAKSFLARPTSPGPNNPNPDDTYSVPEATPACAGEVCVHYVITTSDAPPLADNGRVGSPIPNGVPDYVDVVLDTTLKARAKYLAAGYRAPKGDGPRGGSTNKTDIYLVDIGGQNLYGYCPTDQKVPDNGPYDAWAYCVIDNDYSPKQYRNGTPLQNLQVTIAHEFFHVVQFAYDITEDRWFLEATAAWVEDEMYDDVDDNLQYLERSPLRLPRVPMDTFGNSFHYGTWIFFRYLSERFPQSQGGLPTVVRDMIRKADGSKGKRDLYSVQAVSSVLGARGTDLPSTMARFAAANRRPAQTYDEGRANNYRPAPLVKTLRLGKGQARGNSVTADHLTTATVRFKPQGRLGKNAQLRIALRMTPVNNGLAAVASIKLSSGKVRVVPIRINRSGVGLKKVPFATKTVKYVEVSMVNAGTSYDCWNGGPYSCRGTSKNDNVKQAYRGTVLGG